jgi:plastocyanin
MQAPERDIDENEFRALLRSPLSAVIGHPAWRNDPAYLKIEAAQTVEVRNMGGRNHTFTEVAEFGGGRVPGRVPPLNFGLQPAPECATAVNVPPGTEARVTGLSVGIHRFECCIHLWMRTLIEVKPNK